MYEAQRAASIIRCRGKNECDKIFRIANDTLVELSDMKIQTSTQNYVATYSPIEYGDVGIFLTRTLSSEDYELIKFNVLCKGINGPSPWVQCYERVTNVYRKYKDRLEDLN
jgi:hypothetical protein